MALGILGKYRALFCWIYLKILSVLFLKSQILNCTFDFIFLLIFESPDDFEQFFLL